MLCTFTLLACCPTSVHCSATTASSAELNQHDDPHPHLSSHESDRRKGPLNDVPHIDVKGIEDMLLEYIDQKLHQRTFEILAGLSIAAKNTSLTEVTNTPPTSSRSLADLDATDSFDGKLIRRFKQFAETRVVNLNIPRAFDAGARTFFFKSECANWWYFGQQ